MKRKFLLVLAIAASFHTASSQHQDTTLITLANFRLASGTFSWRGTNTYHDMTSWNSAPYTEGHLLQKNGASWFFRMNYRLLLPVGYDASYTKGYPIIIMLHGGGERGNCWDDNCYCSGCDPNDPPTPGTNAAYLNNDHELLHGGQQYLAAVNLAGTRKPGDAGMPSRAFPGFVLFPQNENSWGSDNSQNSPVSYALRILRLVMKQYKVDPNRVYIHGLSAGGQGVYKALNMADWLFAAATTMSAIPYVSNLEYENVSNIPLWAFQGGRDLNPTPVQTESLIEKYREAGGTVRYTYYPDAGHNTWNRAYNEPDFFSWFLTKSKSDIHVRGANPNICTSTDESISLKLTPGFLAYQWERDGQIMPNESGHILRAGSTGSYRGRFSRISNNPGESQWNEWSKPLVVGKKSPATPRIDQIGTTYLRDLNGEANAYLTAPEGYGYYHWLKDGKVTDHPDTSVLVVQPNACAFCTNEAKYSVVVADFDSCPSLPSEIKYLFFENSAPVNNRMWPADFNYQLLSPTNAFLMWTDPSDEERAYEIWRRNASLEGSRWDFITLTRRNATFYNDTTLLPDQVYYYKIRALAHNARSDYAPGNDAYQEAQNLVVRTPNENPDPASPQNLTAKLSDVSVITLSWEAPKNTDVREYLIEYTGGSVSTGSDAAWYKISNIDVNKTYQFTVKAINAVGYTSPPSNQISVHTDFSGLFYKHSTGAWTDLNDATLRATWDDAETSGTVENITLTPRVQEDYFNFQFEGFLYISQAGTYTFYLNSNDGSRLFIDNTQRIDFNGIHGLCSGTITTTNCPNGWGRPSQPIQLAAGRHHIKVQMFDYTGGHDLVVRYAGPDTGNMTVVLPTTALHTGSYSPPAGPPAPSNAIAIARGMTQIEVAWQGGSSAQYEVFRATSSSGPFEIITRHEATSYLDRNLRAGTTYYYRIRTVNNNGVSAYSNTASTKTVSDNQPPTVPQDVRISSGTRAETFLVWSQSTDNVKVAGYEVWINGNKASTTTAPGYRAANLDQSAVYSFHVVAYDDTGNRSAASTAVTNEQLVTGMDNRQEESFVVNLYPNPAFAPDLNIQVITDTPHAVAIRILDTTGRSVYVHQFDAPTLRNGINLELPVLTNGMYIVIVQQANKVLKQKVILNAHR